MIEFISMTEDNVLGFRIVGKIDGTSVERLAEALDGKLKRLPFVKVYIEVEKVEGISFAALVKELRLALRHVGEIEREAIVSHGDWMGTALHLAGKIFPGTTVKHFTFEEKPNALEWILS